MSEPLDASLPTARGGDGPPEPRPAGLAGLASEVFAAIPEIADDMRARPGGETCPQFLARLVASATPEEAVTFCAYLLPPAAAVAWGHRCLAAKPAASGPADAFLMDLIAAWLAAPSDGPESEELRREILAIAEASRPRSPAVWIALGLGWSSGSISAPDLPAVPAPAFATPRAINAGILGLLARGEIAGRAAELQDFVALARRIAAAIVAGEDFRPRR
ncbi:DUF6931 family protein [Jiella avicenniae]|uniref:Uncharacterized protein n=1 Tax=Jiella avicenniae TaxID=2907202 RepID=A0A9X1T4U1_9HYPH|nr:hypothetical protein [Jiella avicenniae]MCE7028377.1 hypothetical protein [Jiella avicenniae]